jgi:hypothetical protein
LTTVLRMFRHVVMFRWAPETDDAARARVRDGLAGLPAVIPAIRAYHFGADAGLAEGNWDFVVVADFDDEAGYFQYRDHEAHHRVIVDAISPTIAARAAVQYPISD